MASPALLTRTPGAQLVSHKAALLVFGRPGMVYRFDDDSAELARAILEACEVPRTIDELLMWLDDEFEGVSEQRQVVLDAVAELTTAGALNSRAQVAHTHLQPALTGARVVLALSGAVASSLGPALVAALQASGAEVRCALTRSARRFVEPRALEALTHAPVVSDLWAGPAGEPAPHIALAEWADAVVVAPATATTLSRVARGDCSDLVSALVTATRAPVLLAPSMNPGMLAAAAVQRNLQQLSADGHFVVWPARGIEVAHSPGNRPLVRGPMPGPDVLAGLIHEWLRVQVTLPAPPTARYWNAAFRQDPTALPWHSDAVEPELLEVLKGLPKGKLLDLGTGLGTVANAANELGFRVVATDVSAEALARAQSRFAQADIDWLEDDVLDTKLRASFSAIVDRCVLHTFPAAQQARYAQAIVRFLKPGGTFALLVHAPEAPAELRTVRFDAEQLQSLLPELTLVSSTGITMADAKRTPAVFHVFERGT